MKTRCEELGVCQAKKDCKVKRSTNNAFTGALNSIDWSKDNRGAVIGGNVTAAKNGTPVYLKNSRQQKAYSAAGVPK